MRQIVATSIIRFLVVLLAAVSASAAGPTITSLSTTSTHAGFAVTITGTNFGSSQGSSTVTFNGTPATALPGRRAVPASLPMFQPPQPREMLL
jgi:hypothetical protein